MLGYANLRSLMMIWGSGVFMGFGLISCTPGTDYRKKIVLPVQQKKIKSAIGSKYFVPKGADVTVRYARDSSFYVQKGAKITLFEKSGENNSIFVEDLKSVTRLKGTQSSAYNSNFLIIADAKTAFQTGLYRSPDLMMAAVPRHTSLSDGAHYQSQTTSPAPVTLSSATTSYATQKQVQLHHDDYDFQQRELERMSEREKDGMRNGKNAGGKEISAERKPEPMHLKPHMPINFVRH